MAVNNIIFTGLRKISVLVRRIKKICCHVTHRLALFRKLADQSNNNHWNKKKKNKHIVESNLSLSPETTHGKQKTIESHSRSTIALIKANTILKRSK